MRNLLRRKLAMWILLMLLSANLQGHPHYWIDVYTTWRFDSRGLISSVQLRWLFDDYYSILLLDDASDKHQDLQEILEKILSNSKRYNYFLTIGQGSQQAEFGKPEQTGIGLRGQRVEIAFRLPLAIPLDPHRSDIVYRVAEPTYFFEMLHAEDAHAILLQDAPSDCRYHLEAPQPDAALVAYAASIGINETGGDSLGIQFAEKVTIRCE
jgi:ABC-type uncharacterized transport system substrate-binding protein